MSKLFASANTDNARTWNGMKTNSTSLNPNVDLFFNIGSARGKFETIAANIAAGIGADKDRAVRLLLWARDVRGGAGERQTFRDAIKFIAEKEFLTYDEARRIMVKVPELGRWDDLKAFVGTGLEDDALEFWATSISSDGLAAKWAPRKGDIANKLRKTLGLTPKGYRRLVVDNTKVIEQFMCSGNWDEINFSHVPSLAAARYQKAFMRNAEASYNAYIAELVKPEAERDPNVKINAAAVYPYDIVYSLRTGNATVASEQWKALPDYMEGSENSGILPLVDVSGSMGCAAGGQGYGSGNRITCMDVAISLGLYVSERNKGIFKDEFITFSSRPKMLSLSGDLKTRHATMERAEWGMSTNVIAAFDLIINSAIKNNIDQTEMPKVLLILSDMQFNNCASYDDSAMEAMTRRFHDAGYERPNVVFWNINSSGNGVPSVADRHGTALVSGFSPAIMTSVIRAETFTPEAIMDETIMSSRYDW